MFLPLGVKYERRQIVTLGHIMIIVYKLIENVIGYAFNKTRIPNTFRLTSLAKLNYKT